MLNNRIFHTEIMVYNYLMVDLETKLVEGGIDKRELLDKKIGFIEKYGLANKKPNLSNVINFSTNYIIYLYDLEHSKKKQLNFLY